MIRTRAAFSDYILKVDFRASADPDAAVFQRISGEGTPQESGYEARLGDSDSSWPAGSITKLFKGDGKLAVKQWHTLEVEMNGDKITVTIDHHKVGNGSDGKSKAGFIALAVNRGAGVEFRNVMLPPNGARVLLKGADLSGWKSVGEAPPLPRAAGC